MSWQRAAFCAAIIVFAHLLSAPLAAAQGGVRVSPIGLVFESPARTASFRVHNEGALPRAFQIDVLLWTQADGDDILTPSTDIIVSPSIFEARPGRTQIIRAALASGVTAGDAERSYRFLLREVLLEDAPAAQGLRIRLDMSMPIFVRASATASAQLVARRNGASLTVANEGAAHVRIAQLQAGRTEIDAPRYLLAGASFTRIAPAGPVHGRIIARDTLAEITLADAPHDSADRR